MCSLNRGGHSGRFDCIYIFDETGVQLSLHGESETSKHNQVIEIFSIHQNRICNIVTTRRFY